MSRTLGEHLVEAGALDRKGLDLALEVTKRNKRRLDEVLRTQRRKEEIGQLAEGLGQAGAFYRRFVEDRFDVLANNVGLVLSFAAAGLLVVGKAMDDLPVRGR